MLLGSTRAKELFDDLPGTMASPKENMDNSNDISAKIVRWEGNTVIKKHAIRNHIFISGYVKNLNKYAKNGNALKGIENLSRR